ncbi:MAG: hypothetical protein V4677_12375 [Bacteroidota bacterium]
MKKILTITCLAILMLTGKAYSQSNLTWTVKDKVEKGFLKTATVINTNFSGFTNKDEATKFYAKIKANPEVASAEVLNSDANGNADIKLTMRQAHNKQYYIGMAQKLGVTYIQINGRRNTPAAMTEEIRSKKK